MQNIPDIEMSAFFHFSDWAFNGLHGQTLAHIFQESVYQKAYTVVKVRLHGVEQKNRSRE